MKFNFSTSKTEIYKPHVKEGIYRPFPLEFKLTFPSTK